MKNSDYGASSEKYISKRVKFDASFVQLCFATLNLTSTPFRLSPFAADVINRERETFGNFNF